jgi:predicted small metal-binding protein
MKTITCAQFGGPCEYAATTNTEKEMKDAMWKHVAEAHPEQSESTKKMMENATQEQMDKTDAYFHSVWESVPENPE